MKGMLVLAALLAFPLASPAAPLETADQRKAVALRVFDEIFNRGRFEVANELYAPDFVNHGMTTDVGLKEDQEAARGWKAAFPDLRMTVTRLLVDGDFVTVVWTADGTNTGAGNGLPATGKTLRCRGITIWRISGGRIREEWSEFDQLRLMQQLGLLPPAPQ